jgi:inhibitor of KinA sporulation pathway (predicted exonuclease)
MNYIIFDLEATCWENDRNKINEIIEVGAVKVNDSLEIIGIFSRFVKPEINQELSGFCKRLTSISQENVDTAQSFSQVICEFEEWILSTGNDVYLCSWGFYDKKQILRECNIKKYFGLIVSLLDRHISIKHQFSKAKNIKPCGMDTALKMLGIQLEGIHHRGIDDAKNIFKVFVSIFQELNFNI